MGSTEIKNPTTLPSKVDVEAQIREIMSRPPLPDTALAVTLWRVIHGKGTRVQ